MTDVIKWPHSPEAEQALLGCVLLDGSLAGELDLELFHDPKNRGIADLLLEMSTAGEPIDTMTAAQRVGQSKDRESLGGFSYISELPDKCATPLQWEYWREILAAKAMLRRTIKTGWQAVLDAQKPEADADAVVESLERAALSVRGGSDGQDEVDLRATIQGLISDLEAVHENPGIIRGLRTGLADVDAILGGLKPQELIILAARPSVGKTSLAMNVAERVAIYDEKPVGVFSLEMSGKELLHRMTCSIAQVDASSMQRRRLTDREITKVTVAHGRINKAKLSICDRAGISVGKLSAIARRMKKRHGIKLLIVDYLGLLNTGERSRGLYEDVSLISKSLKGIAKELDVPIIALAQLNRDVEKNDRKPRLSDLRDSGSIEQDADVVMFLHRSGEPVGECQPVECIIAKHRNGATGKADLTFLRNITRFENAAKEYAND